MRSIKTLLSVLALTLLVSGSGLAGTHLNEVGALLVYPQVGGLVPIEFQGAFVQAEEVVTLVTITNAGGDDVVAHVSFIDGASERIAGIDTVEPNPEYCFECDFFVPMSPNDTDTLVFYKDPTGGRYETTILELDTGLEHTCAAQYGMVIVTLENASEETLQDNVLLGEQIVINFGNNYAWSTPAIPFQGKNMGDADRWYRFDDQEYGKMPRIVAADFIAPDQTADMFADLIVFTLGFERQHPPEVDCSVTGFDASENPFSRSILFGCWELFDLQAISSEFAFGNLGAFACDPTVDLDCDDHGWLSLNCRVDPDADGTYEIDGGVHGAITQFAAGSAVVARPTGDPITGGSLSTGGWSRLLYQSVTTGSSLTLHLEGPGGSLLEP